jgi:hypothetical protein
MMLERIGAQRVRFHCPEAFANINTRIDLAVLASRLEQEAATPSAQSCDEDCLPRYQR